MIIEHNVYGVKRFGTITEAAQWLGVSRQNLSRWMNGQCRPKAAIMSKVTLLILED